MTAADSLIIQGAREHNLRNVSLTLPRNSMVVFTGLSGSGKSSLAFDTIFAEGQRRYIESLSSYARQFLGQLDKPDVDFIAGLSPAVSIDQKSTNRNPRSTVGTITEVHDYLRLLFARAGRPHCPVCAEPIGSQSAQQITDQVLELPPGTRYQVLAPVVRGRKGEHLSVYQELITAGFTRARTDGKVHSLQDLPQLVKQKKHSIEVVVDRLVSKGPDDTAARSRLHDSIETALETAAGIVVIEQLPARDAAHSNSIERRYSEHLACPNEHEFGVDSIEPRSFSFNSPYGACPKCSGLGTELQVDLDLVIPDPEKTLAQGAIAPWSRTVGGSNYFARLIASLAKKLDFSLHTPWYDLPERAHEALLWGYDQVVRVEYNNRFGRKRVYSSTVEGVFPWLERRLQSTDSEHARAVYRSYMREISCPSCNGARLKPELLAVTIGGKNIAEISAFSIKDAAHFLAGVSFTAREAAIAEQVIREIQARLGFLLDVGLDYLSLDRAAGSLSGGEAQRIRLATQIGAGLVGVLYVLDEPSIGLHQRDNARLIETLVRLRDLGNTLIVVEHDEETIATADWVVDIGPGAGEHGGEIVYSGPVSGLGSVANSLTGAYLSGQETIPVPQKRRRHDGRVLSIIEASQHTLKNIRADFPLGLFVAVTGVSGSGKSTLVNDILYTALAGELHGSQSVPGRHKKITGIEHIDKVVHVDQGPIGRTPRSNPATYTGVFDHIRKLFASTPEAKVRGYMPGRFSFNVKGGRCESCKGDGTLKIEMNFLPSVYVPCEVCAGARYNRETLEVKYRGKSISEVLDMPISQAAEFFSAIPAIARHMDTLTAVGLGYVRLGQSAPTLSGGEAQRVKLASELHKRSNGRSLYVLDEPTTGLHFADISKLLSVLHSLVDKGNTVIVIEHNLDVVKTADWVIDLGPEGGDEGGQIVVAGTPEEVSTCPESHTGKYLASTLSK